MARWLNRVTIAAPRNGTTTHSVDPSSASNVVDGINFAPTTGRLLVCFAAGAVTSTTPSGWTLPTGGSAVSATGLYVWYRIAAGGDTFSTTHGGSDYPVVFDIYEFLEASTLLGSAAQADVAETGGAGPTLSGLAGTHLDFGVVCQNAGDSTNPLTCNWDMGTRQVVWSALRGGSGPTDGYVYSLTYVEDSATSSAAFAATMIGDSLTLVERLVVSVQLSGGDVDQVALGQQVTVA